jgi:peptidoglycan/xylan/chitin deacetylase (PgdA/CDA1 family)
MIDVILTIDYEIFGNGTGSVREHILQPMEAMAGVFRQYRVKSVIFVEVAELQRLEVAGNAAMPAVRTQLRRLRDEGHEIALHLHPQWYNARLVEQAWHLDYSEYNLCTLTETRIREMVGHGVEYLQTVLGDSRFTPFSFRAGNWLFQPTLPAANVLHERGVRVDSSVFKGGRQHAHGLDYRRAMRNGDYWRFGEDVNVPCHAGALLEIPIYTRMVPFWRMMTARRLKADGPGKGRIRVSVHARLCRLFDRLRWLYPCKFDFCRMSPVELDGMLNHVLAVDRKSPGNYHPVVLIGHTKDTPDPAVINDFLLALRSHEIRTVTFTDAYPKCGGVI